MTKKLSSFLPSIVILAIILILGFIQYKGNSTKSKSNENKVENTSKQEFNETNLEKSASNNLQGILKISDNLKRGNLMLNTNEKTIYLFTSRDYSDLFDQEVNVEIEGTLDNFRLINIKSK